MILSPQPEDTLPHRLSPPAKGCRRPASGTPSGPLAWTTSHPPAPRQPATPRPRLPSLGNSPEAEPHQFHRLRPGTRAVSQPASRVRLPSRSPDLQRDPPAASQLRRQDALRLPTLQARQAPLPNPSTPLRQEFVRQHPQGALRGPSQSLPRLGGRRPVELVRPPPRRSLGRRVRQAHHPNLGRAGPRPRQPRLPPRPLREHQGVRRARPLLLPPSPASPSSPRSASSPASTSSTTSPSTPATPPSAATPTTAPTPFSLPNSPASPATASVSGTQATAGAATRESTTPTMSSCSSTSATSQLGGSRPAPPGLPL